MSARAWWLSIAAIFVIAMSSGCNCGRARIVSRPDGGDYTRVAPAHGFAAGAVVSKSPHFQLVGELNAPAGAASRSQNFQLKGGVVEASQE